MITFNKEKLQEFVKNYNEPFKDAIKEFFNDKHNQDLININSFDELYNNYFNSYYSRSLFAPGLFTALLLLSDVDFLHYMDEIPGFCFHELPIISIEIPNNIISIAYRAFSECKNLKNVTISSNVADIDTGVFQKSTVKTLTYLGTVEEWENINKASDWNVASKIDKIICKDDIISQEPLYTVKTRDYDRYVRSARITPKGTITLYTPAGGGFISSHKGNPSDLILFKSIEEAEELQVILERVYNIPFEVTKYQREYDKLKQVNFNNYISLHGEKIEVQQLQQIEAYIKA